MEEDVILNGAPEAPILNGDEIVVPPVADTDIPLTPDVPIDIDTTTVVDNGIGNFFGTIQESITIAWRYHLKTRKHRVHVTLNEYYDDAIPMIDAIIEQYQGTTGIVVENYTNTIFEEGKTEVEYFQELKAFVVAQKTSNNFDDELISTIENYQGLIDSTLYKLTSFTESAIKSFDEFCFEDYDVIGVEGGVDGVFDTVTKTTKNNVAPAGASTGGSCPKCKSGDCTCDKPETKDEEEEEEE